MSFTGVGKSCPTSRDILLWQTCPFTLFVKKNLPKISEFTVC